MQNLLLLHGALGAKSQFEKLVAEMKPFYNCYALDFSAHGGATMPESFSIAQFASEVIDYLDRNGIASINIFGYSMGGYVALYLAHKFPHRVNKIYTLATKFDWTIEVADRETAMLNAEKIEQKLPAFANLLVKRHAPNDWKAILEKTKAMMLDLGANPTLSTEKLKEIYHEVIISLGDNDKMVNIDESITAADSLLNGAFKLLAQTPHPFEQVDTNLLKAELKSFFN